MRTYKRKAGFRYLRNPARRMTAAARLRDEGLSLRESAERLAWSYETVRRDLARWDREHANVVPLSQTAVTKSPPGGQIVTPECDSSNVVPFRKQA